jgi:hypothetical protein
MVMTHARRIWEKVAGSPILIEVQPQGDLIEEQDTQKNEEAIELIDSKDVVNT